MEHLRPIPCLCDIRSLTSLNQETLDRSPQEENLFQNRTTVRATRRRHGPGRPDGPLDARMDARSGRPGLMYTSSMSIPSSVAEAPGSPTSSDQLGAGSGSWSPVLVVFLKGHESTDICTVSCSSLSFLTLKRSWGRSAFNPSFRRP